MRHAVNSIITAAKLILSLSPDGKMLATTAKGGNILFLWPATTKHLNRSASPVAPGDEDFALLWRDLGNVNYEKADKAWYKLRAAGDAAIPFLRQQIRLIAMPEGEKEHIDKLIVKLNADKYAVRASGYKGPTGQGRIGHHPAPAANRKTAFRRNEAKGQPYSQANSRASHNT